MKEITITIRDGSNWNESVTRTIVAKNNVHVETSILDFLEGNLEGFEKIPSYTEEVEFKPKDGFML